MSLSDSFYDAVRRMVQDDLDRKARPWTAWRVLEVTDWREEERLPSDDCGTCAYTQVCLIVMYEDTSCRRRAWVYQGGFRELLDELLSDDEHGGTIMVFAGGYRGVSQAVRHAVHGQKA